MNDVLEAMAQELPPMIPRTLFGEFVAPYFGGKTFSKGYLENMDSKGTGPKVTKVGKRVFYAKSDLLAWLEAKMN